VPNKNNDLLAIGLFVLVGIIGVPLATYQWMSDVNNGWICYSRHGHILESSAECKFQVFAGLMLCTFALMVGLYASWNRFKGQL
jgi:hypothetical protein